MQSKLILPVTASWSTPLSAAYTAVGISRGPPRGTRRGYRMYRALAPGGWFRSDADTFCRLYMAQLRRLDSQQVLDDLARLSGGKIPALLCFEKPPPHSAWCHRALVAGWLEDALAIKVCELGHEALGGGWQHPKLPPGLRRSRRRA